MKTHKTWRNPDIDRGGKKVAANTFDVNELSIYAVSQKTKRSLQLKMELSVKFVILLQSNKE